ncbi:MAG: hypothetical protein FJY95_14610 [Candidatus Handelsmanbacteria bacterium]|nr:hypothetical protein [Candidatus Handelsmanbacteria bacterium]
MRWHRRAQIAALEAGSLAGRTGFNTKAMLGGQASPGDFMILTRTTACLPLYARALEERGIPYDLAGSRFSGSADLRPLVEMAEAIAAFEEALSLAMYLRGALVGLGDDEFYAFRRAGGIFGYTQPLPAVWIFGCGSASNGPWASSARNGSGSSPSARPQPGCAWWMSWAGSPLSPRGRPVPRRPAACYGSWAGQELHWVPILRELRELLDDPDYKAEEMTLEAEELRLLYVAATRAAELLVVSCYEGNAEAGPWAALYPALEKVPVLPECEMPLPAPAPAPAPAWDWEALERERRARWVQVVQPSVQVPPRLGEEAGYGALAHQLLGAAVEGRLPAQPAAHPEMLIDEAGLPLAWRSRLEEVLATFRASPFWAQVQEAAQVHTEVKFAGAGGVRGVIDLVFRVAGGWKIVDYQSETAPFAPALEAGARHWEQLTGEEVVERGAWLCETGAWQPC